MFSSHDPVVESAAAARRRHRPISRPTSRTQHRPERSMSNASFGRNVRDGSVMSQRGGSGSFADRELVVAGKAMSFSSSRGDGGKDMDGGAVDWTRNNRFRVSKLPALPSFIKTSGPIPITATADAANGYALILSHNAAYVWQYTSTHTIPHTLSFPLPTEEHGIHSPFPLGDLVSPSANSDEPGLVVVMPTSGRIAYWDSVGSAVAEGLFTKRRGVEGKVPLVSGESVTAVCNAEPAGFILSLSSGRLAHLALRDLAGRPGIAVTIMRGYGTGMMGGFLGALRAGSNRRDIVAVRAGRALRMGEREVIVATARGNFSRWQVNRSGTYANIADVDVRDAMLSKIETMAPEEVKERSKDAFVIVDVAVGENHQSANSESQDVDAHVLASFMPSSSGSGALHVLISLKFRAGGNVEVSKVHVVKCYTTPLEEGKTRPRVYLPRPGTTAFLVFSRAVVLVSTQKSGANKDAMEYDLEEQGSFEDVVDFRGDLNVEIVGGGPEDVAFDSTPRSEVMGSFTSETGASGTGKKIRNPGVILVAKGAGIVRLETFDLEPVKKETLSGPVKVKSKIEQAVFYGVKEDNPLNFRGRKEIEYSIEEIEAASLAISSEIVSSTSQYLPGLLPSLDGHLSLRVTHLRALAEHLKSTFPSLSRETMWRLLSDAEKCHAARAVWNLRDTHLRHRPEGEQGVLDVIISDLLSGDGIGDDPIRTWFLRFVGSIEDLLPLAKRAVVEESRKGHYDHPSFIRMVSEANDIVLGALMKAWDFRVRSAKLYGLDTPGVDSNGMLQQGAGLAPPWTSETEILQALSVQYDICHALLKSVWGPRLVHDEERWEAVERIAEQLVGLAEVCCRGFEERSTWCEQQRAAGEGILQEGITVRERYYASRGDWIKPLAEVGRLNKAYEIAEKWQDYRSLVELCWEELMRADIALKEVGGTGASKVEREEEKNELMKSKKSASERLDRYFKSSGEVFAIEFYEFLVENHHLHVLLNGFENWHEKYLTPFLRSNKKYAKLSWMHDVSLGDFSLAAETLLEVATEQEDDQWNKKIELSIGKLAKIAAVGHLGEQEVRLIDSELELVDIQNRIYHAVKFIGHSTIDTDAAVQEGLAAFAGGVLTSKKRAGCRRLWQAAFARAVKGKVMGVEEIADLLTLTEGGEDYGLVIAGCERGQEFFWALKALSLGGLRTERRKFAERTIWRRCFLRDRWSEIVDTRNKTDQLVQEAARETAVYKTIKLGYENGLFSTNSPYQPLAPEETFFSEETHELKTRFARADESELALIGHDLGQENKLLARLIERANLRAWFPGVLDAAKREALSGWDEGDTKMEMEE